MSHPPVNFALNAGQLLGAGSDMADFAGAVLRSQAAILSRQGLSDSTTALAVELAQTLSCTRVSIGLSDGRQITIAGTSQARDVDQRLDAAAIV